MTMSEVGRPGQLVDPINGGDVAADGTLLSVAEIQQRFREERARRGLAVAPAAPQMRPARPTATAARPATVVSVAKPSAEPSAVSSAEAAGQVTAAAPAPAAPERVAPTPAAAQSPTAPPARPSGQPDASAAQRSLEIPLGWVRVLAGHSGAGSSTIALALADAAAATGRPSQVIEAASRAGPAWSAQPAENSMSTSPERGGKVPGHTPQPSWRSPSPAAPRTGSRPVGQTPRAPATCLSPSTSDSSRPTPWPTQQAAPSWWCAGPRSPASDLPSSCSNRLGDTTCRGRHARRPPLARRGHRQRRTAVARAARRRAASSPSRSTASGGHRPHPRPAAESRPRGRPRAAGADRRCPSGRRQRPPTPAQTAPRQKGTTR